MNRAVPTIAAVGMLLATAAAANAATVSFVGSDINTTGGDWRTTTAVKPLDADSDNIYGTDGYLRDSANSKLDPSYATAVWLGGSAFGTGNTADDPTQPPGPAVPDYNTNEMYIGGKSGTVNTDFIQITMTQTADFRVGVFVDFRQWPEGEGTNGVRVRQTVGGTGDSTMITLLSQGITKNHVVDHLLFDVVGAAPGDVFIISSENDPGWGEDSLTVAYFDTVTVDPIPEPMTLSLLALGGLGVLIRRRRR